MAASLDPTSLLGAALRLVVVASVDLAAATCRVQDGDIESGDLPWLAPRAGTTRIWSPPSVGEQALLICPEGDILAAVVLPGLFSDAHPAPGAGREERIVFSDGAELAYDPDAHALTALLPAGGTVAIDAPGGITLRGPLRVEGDVDLQGKLTATEDVLAAGKSLKGHKHLGVTAGSAVSGAPQ